METRTLTAVIHRVEDMLVPECPEVGTVKRTKGMLEDCGNG